MAKKHYVLFVWGGTEPSLSEAFDTTAKRDQEAERKHKEDSSPENGLFWMDVDAEGNASVGAYTDDQFVSGATVLCKFCGGEVPESTAHRHGNGWVGDECCWDERLRNGDE